MFVDELFPTLTTPFQGVLRIRSTSTQVAVVGLRACTNERGDFLITTTPPSDEASVTASAARIFPQLADGGGWTTRFILFSGQQGQPADGSLRFFSQGGEPLGLTIQ